MLFRLFVFLLLSTSLWAALSPEEGLKRLQMGNQRFVDEDLLHPNRSGERRTSLLEKQPPFAVIVTCSDSRVVPEVIFDEGLGDLFVIRVAGNVVDTTELESVQYAVDHLNPGVVVVMGHENCGAVDAVLHGQTQDIPAIAAFIEPSTAKAKGQPNPLERAIKLNAKKMSQLLLTSSIIDKKVQSKTLGVHAAYYNMQTGAVEFLGHTQKNSS